ncbi:hypothetical protein QFZ77_005488 [Paenibacillus sp. V4I3]|nr:hypothetical protein [Paenibacillus sp. V4I3]
MLKQNSANAYDASFPTENSANAYDVSFAKAKLLGGDKDE